MKANLEIQIDLDKLSEWKQKVLHGIQSYSTFAYLDNNQYNHSPNRYELLVGIGCKEIVPFNNLNAKKGDWLFGHITYDFKNTLFPRLKSEHKALDEFDAASFFVPQIVIALPHKASTLYIYAEGLENIQQWWGNFINNNLSASYSILQWESQPWQQLTAKESYIEQVEKVKEHIVNGDCYELNLCCAYHRKVRSVQPTFLFELLNANNAAPFAAYYRRDQQYLLATSPERYLHRQASIITSQPIKGTIRKGNDELENEALKEQLKADIKERAENVMITDLVRNDLASLSVPGSIIVPELFGTYTFSSLHHLISTVQGTLLSSACIEDMLAKPFPMGSMTGAPKYIVMQIIEALEDFKRGIYSGSVGYILPNGDFDFNVIIRSVVYNELRKELAFHAGGAITIDSIPVKEWEEIQLKAQRTIDLLQQFA